MTGAVKGGAVLGTKSDLNIEWLAKKYVVVILYIRGFYADFAVIMHNEKCIGRVKS
jgi:hypothetical protein